MAKVKGVVPGQGLKQSGNPAAAPATQPADDNPNQLPAPPGVSAAPAFGTLTPQEYERQAVPQFIAKAKDYDGRVKAFLQQTKAKGRAHSSELKAALRELDQWESYFRAQQATAKLLAEANLPTMRNWLDWAAGDLPGLKQVIKDWAAQAEKAEKEMAGIITQSDTDVHGILQQMNTDRQASFNKMNEKWREYFKR